MNKLLLVIGSALILLGSCKKDDSIWNQSPSRLTVHNRGVITSWFEVKTSTDTLTNSSKDTSVLLKYNDNINIYHSKTNFGKTEMYVIGTRLIKYDYRDSYYRIITDTLLHINTSNEGVYIIKNNNYNYIDIKCLN